MQETIRGILALLVYVVIAAGTAFGCRMLIRIPDELFRKILHCIFLGAMAIFVFFFPSWQASALTAVVFAIVAYPVLAWFERFRQYSSVTTERRKGELKESLLLVFGMFALVTAICWGWVGDRWLVLASVYAWGFGDAAAALVGKQWGKHKIHLPHADNHKSVEGSSAMFLCSVLSVTVVLSLRGGLSGWKILLIAVLTALVSTLAELYSKDGYDTAICPLSAMAVLLPLLRWLGGAP